MAESSAASAMAAHRMRLQPPTGFTGAERRAGAACRLCARLAQLARAHLQLLADEAREAGAVLEAAFARHLGHVEVGVLQHPAGALDAQSAAVLRGAQADVL